MYLSNQSSILYVEALVSERNCLLDILRHTKVLKKAACDQLAGRVKTSDGLYSDCSAFAQSALQLTEVLKERDAQLEFKQLKEAASQGKDRAYLEQAQRDLEEAIRRDQTEAQHRIAAAKKNKDFIKAQ